MMVYLNLISKVMRKLIHYFYLKLAGTFLVSLLFLCTLCANPQKKLVENHSDRPLRVDRGIMSLGLIAVPVVLLCGYRMISDYLVSHTDSTEARNLDTGVLPGAEQYDLGDVDSNGAVLMVHGFLGAGNNFNDLPERLAGLGWYVRVMRLPGHGTSPRDLEYVTADSLVQAVCAELKDLQRTHDRVVLLGHSMGGTLCTLVASQHAVDRLVLCAPYFGVTYKKSYILRPETWTHIFYPVIRWVYKGDAFIRVNRSEVKDRIVSYRWVSMHGINTLYELGNRASSSEVLNQVICPVLLIHSQGDEAASPECSKKAFNAMKSTDKYAVWLETSNHHIFWDYERDTVMSEIERYLGSP